MRIEELGKTIKELRKENGLTQMKLAELADISLAFVCRIENQGASMSLLTLFCLLEVMGYEMEFKRKEQIE